VSFVNQKNEKMIIKKMEAATWVTKKNPQGWKALPIHLACIRRAPLSVIKSLIQAYPDGAKEKSHNGDLPIHLAIRFGASDQVWNHLYQAYPECEQMKDHDGSTYMDLMKARMGLKSYDDKVENQNEKLQEWQTDDLSIVVVGASGDLAKKKTYPSLLALYADSFLPPDTVIWGFARSDLSHEDLRSRLKPFLLKSHDETIVDGFLSICYYQSGKGYGDQAAFAELNTHLIAHEDQVRNSKSSGKHHNRLFYFAIPPNVFAETGLAIKKNAMAQGEGSWSRMIVEKPFGRDLDSCKELLKVLDENFKEEQIYRIDHYLGKEIVQNLLIMRFSNRIYENVWSSHDIQSVFLTFKEPFGTKGRGGYFNQYGIIRDIIQNHLCQVMSLVAMEAPARTSGPGSSDDIRDEKVKILKCIQPVTLDDVYLGQYEGYTNDETIEDKDSNTPTYAAIRLFINTPRWYGVPFILKAGKALDERKAEVRIQFKDAKAANFMFEETKGNVPRNELVMRMQPHEAIYMKTNFKSPGFSLDPVQGELGVNYDDRFFKHGEISNPEAYTRLILNVIQGRQAAFVRDDELIRSWEIFTPILNQIENEKIRPHSYTYGSRGPKGADAWIQEKSGYVRNTEYKFYNE